MPDDHDTRASPDSADAKAPPRTPAARRNSRPDAEPAGLSASGVTSSAIWLGVVAVAMVLLLLSLWARS
jgi:hypothetical protein